MATTTELSDAQISTVRDGRAKSPTTVEIPSPPAPKGDRRLWHLPSQGDDERGLCGISLLKGHPGVFMPDGAPDSCVVCDEMNRWLSK
jgi:hypothetical protein